jgi:hypothetical protein
MDVGFVFDFNLNQRLWACGRRVRRWATRRARSAALSTAAPGALKAHCPYVHSLPAAQRPAPAPLRQNSCRLHFPADDPQRSDEKKCNE